MCLYSIVWKALTVLYALNSYCRVKTAKYYVKFSVYSAAVSSYCVCIYEFVKVNYHYTDCMRPYTKSI